MRSQYNTFGSKQKKQSLWQRLSFGDSGDVLYFEPNWKTQVANSFKRERDSMRIRTENRLLAIFINEECYIIHQIMRFGKNSNVQENSGNFPLSAKTTQ